MLNHDISSLETHIGYWLRCLSNFVSNSFAQKLAKHNISVPQWVVLRILYDSPESNLNDTAIKIGVDKSSLSRLIDRLVLRGFIKRQEGKDRRTVVLSLAPKGLDIVPRLAEEADLNDKEFFSSLSDKHKEEFISTLKQLLSTNGWKDCERGQDKMK